MFVRVKKQWMDGIKYLHPDLTAVFNKLWVKLCSAVSQVMRRRESEGEKRERDGDR